MRLDLVITELDVGGAETFCVELAKFLASRGHVVRVIAIGKPPSSDRDRLVRELQDAKIELRFLGCSSVFSIFRAIKYLRDLWKAEPPDVVQSLLWHANVLCACGLGHAKIPLVGGVRVSDPRRWRFWFSRWAARRMVCVVCVSHSTREWCEKVEGIPSSKLVVIPNGVDVASQQYRARDPIEHPVYVRGVDYLLYAGRLHEQKGIDIVLQRADRMLRALPSFHLVFVGDGPWRARVEAYSQGSHHRDRIHVIGQSNQVPGWMRGCHVLILPTRFEGMPNVLLEAMSLGKPVATMAVQGVEEVLGDTSSDQSVSAGDWDGWEAMVIELCQDRERSQRLGEANKIRVASEFNLKSQLSRYEELYRDVVEVRH